MVFSWLQRRRRQKLLAEPVPAAWLEILQRNIGHYHYLSQAEQSRLHDDLRVLVAEKNWEGVKGLEITDEIKVTIAGLAAFLLLGIEHDYFAQVMSILVNPGDFVAPRRNYEMGFEMVEDAALSGEAVYRGPVKLSWRGVLANARHPGHGSNLVWHEFAHQLDMADRSVDGTPPLGSRDEYTRWQQVMTREFDRLTADAAAGRPTLLDEYGATNEAEFFAVSTETFFDMPLELRAVHPELYALLRDYYRQDPAARMPR